MDEKIKWYEEILHLDPARLFFPLARLYAQNNELDKAIQTLRSGLDKDPRHFEARMFLVSLLSRQGLDLDQDAGLLDGITTVLEQYPEVWTVWARELEKSGNKDLGVALRCVSCHLQGQPVSWSEIIRQGFTALAQENEPGMGKEQESAVPSGILDGELDFVTAEASEEERSGDIAPSEEDETEQGAKSEILQDDAGLEMELQDQPAQEGTGGDIEQGSSGSGSDSLSSYRTRTMADILAEQGDYSQALDIYIELQQKAQSDEDYEDLQASIQAMQEQIEGSLEQSGDDQEQAAPSSREQKTALVSRLERLAQRLESREGRA
jgi:tetratricopeptide (TPR) repeat protein